MAPTPGFRPREDRSLARELRQTLQVEEVMDLLEGTLAIERALTELYEKAIRRSTARDVAERMREFAIERDRRIRALERTVEDLGGNPRREPTVSEPAVSFIASAANARRSGLLGTFADVMDLWTAESRAFEDWTIVRNVAFASGEPRLLTLAEAAPEEDVHRRFFAEVVKDMTYEVFLAAESEVAGR